MESRSEKIRQVRKRDRRLDGDEMGFEELQMELQKNAEANAKKILRSAENTAGKAIEDAEAKAADALRTARKEAAEYVKKENAERMTSAKLAAKKIVEDAKDEAVESCLKQVWSDFKAKSLSKSSYQKLLQKLVKDGISELGSGEAIVFVRDEDRNLLSGMKLGKLPSEYCGGAIVESANGKVRVNKTLEEIFAQKRSELRKEIFDRIF